MIIETLIAICTVIKVISTTLLSIKAIDLKTSYFISCFVLLPFIVRNWQIGENWQAGLFAFYVLTSIVGFILWRERKWGAKETRILIMVIATMRMK